MATFTLGDLTQKSTETSGYIAVDGKVYNITDYMVSHPLVSRNPKLTIPGDTH